MTKAADGKKEIRFELERGSPQKVNKIVYVFAKLRDVLNSNSSIEALDTLTLAFEDLIGSQGWHILDLSINTVANSLSIYNSIASGVDRVLRRKRLKQEDQDKATKEMDTSMAVFQDELNNFMQQIITQFTVVNKRMKCLSEAQIENGRGDETLKDCSHFPEDALLLTQVPVTNSLMGDKEMANNEFENENENNLEFVYYGDPPNYYYLPTIG